MTKSIKSNAAKAKQFFADKMAFTTGPVEISHQIEKGLGQQNLWVDSGSGSFPNV